MSIDIYNYNPNDFVPRGIVNLVEGRSLPSAADEPLGRLSGYFDVILYRRGPRRQQSRLFKHIQNECVDCLWIQGSD